MSCYSSFRRGWRKPLSLWAGSNTQSGDLSRGEKELCGNWTNPLLTPVPCPVTRRTSPARALSMETSLSLSSTWTGALNIYRRMNPLRSDFPNFQGVNDWGGRWSSKKWRKWDEGDNHWSRILFMFNMPLRITFNVPLKSRCQLALTTLSRLWKILQGSTEHLHFILDPNSLAPQCVCLISVQS